MAIYNGKEILFNPQLNLGASDYDELANKPIINQDLSADGFTPEAGTYYRHTGTDDGADYATGKIYYYDGTEYKAIDGENGSGSTPNDGKLKIQRNGVLVAEFTANQSKDTEANIIVPTKTSQLTNDSGFGKGTVKSVAINGTTYTPDSNGFVDLGEISGGGVSYASIYNNIY